MDNVNKILGKLFNTLGNAYLTKNFQTGPFEFKVNFRKSEDDDLQDYIIEVYSIPDIPRRFTYKPSKKNDLDGIHISVLKHKFREYIKYVDPTFGEFRKTVGVKFMNVK